MAASSRMRDQKRQRDGFEFPGFNLSDLAAQGSPRPALAGGHARIALDFLVTAGPGTPELMKRPPAEPL